jgi:hypothetical protein
MHPHAHPIPFLCELWLCSFKDAPDVISALGNVSSDGNTPAASDCAVVLLSTSSTGASADTTSVTSGNIKAAVGADGKLTFTRVSDGKTLLTEKSVRSLVPTTTVPPVAGFLSLEMAFAAVEGERIYGLGQHAAFSWDKNFPVNGQLDQKGV